MSTSIIDIGGVDVRSAPCFMPDCYFPITDMVKRCPPDEVLMNMPMLIGHWATNTKAPALLNSQLSIDTSGISDECCDTATVKRTTQMGEMYAPNMKEIALGSGTIKMCDLLEPFCDQRNIKPEGLCIFNPDGSIAAGEPYALDFMRMATSDPIEAMMGLISNSALTGSVANRFQIDGLYTQIDNGWEPVTGPGCPPIPDHLNVGTTIDWAAMTDPADHDPSGCAGPDAKTIATTIQVWGQPCNVPAGLTFAQFLEDIWFNKVEREWTDSRGGVDAWEAHVGLGSKVCLLNNADCMSACQSCGSNSNDGFTVNADLERMFASMSESRRTSIMELKPSNRRVALMESRHIEDNTVRIGPRSVGGRPTYGMFFRNIAEVVAGMPMTYGTGMGTTDYDNFLAPETRNLLRMEFESQAFYGGMTRENLRCMRSEAMTQYGMLACWRHAWLKVENMCCCGCVGCGDTDASLLVDGVPVTT